MGKSKKRHLYITLDTENKLQAFNVVNGHVAPYLEKIEKLIGLDAHTNFNRTKIIFFNGKNIVSSLDRTPFFTRPVIVSGKRFWIPGKGSALWEHIKKQDYFSLLSNIVSPHSVILNEPQLVNVFSRKDVYDTVFYHIFDTTTIIVSSPKPLNISSLKPFVFYPHGNLIH
jgi:hypothetical protein